MSKRLIDLYDKLEQIASARKLAYEEMGYEFDTDNFFDDLTNKEVIPLVGSYYLGEGSHKICFRKGNKVYSLFHTDDDEEMSIINQNLKSTIWPKAKYIAGKLYVMPFYKVLNDTQLNSAKTYLLETLGKLNDISEPIDKQNKFYDKLPRYIINGLNEAVKIGPLNCDVHPFNIGWHGDRPIFFDAYWFDYIR